MNLDIIPNGAIKRVHVSQNDVGRTLTFELFNNSTSYTVPSGAVVKIQGTKPSGFGFSETCTVNGNVATVDTTEEMTDESGNIQTELSISYGDVVIGTSNFVLAVERNPHPDTTTDGSMATIIPELTLLVNEVKGYAEEIEGTYHAYGSPWVASTVAQMTDTDKIYVYTGSESGYTNGNWYYYNGSSWVSGGVYNAVAVNIDDTLTIQGACADAKVVGDEISDLKSNISNSFDNRAFCISGHGERASAGNGVRVNIKKSINTGDVFYAVVKAYNGSYYKGAQLYGVVNGAAEMILSKGSSWAIGNFYKITATKNYDSLYFWVTNSTNEVCSAEAFIATQDFVSNGLMGTIYSGTINVNRSDSLIEWDTLRVLTSYGKYLNLGSGSVAFDTSSAQYVGFYRSDSSTLVVKSLGYSDNGDFVILFAYNAGNLYFTDMFENITIDDAKYNKTNKARTICCLGDSFTAGSSGTSWWGYVANHTGYRMVGLGVAGTRMTVTYTSGGNEYKCFIDRVADGALDSYAPSLIIVFGGINDAVKLHNNQCTIGEITDQAEYDATVTSGYSFIGRVKFLINLIKTKKPGVPILGVLPPDYSEGTSDYSWWYDYIGQIREALKAVYEFYGIPIVNLKKDCQEMYIDEYNLSTYRVNGLSNMHPSPAGHEAIGKTIYTKGIADMFY